MPRHALIVGGTGMLEICSHALTDNANQVTMLARSAVKGLTDRPNVHFIQADYSDSGAWDLIQEVHQKEPFDFALVWIHSTGKDFLDALKKALLIEDKNCTVYQVMGSNGFNRTKVASEIKQFEGRFRGVVLGHKIDKGNQRWLTHEEISEGTSRAIKLGSTYTEIGIVD